MKLLKFFFWPYGKIGRAKFWAGFVFIFVLEIFLITQISYATIGHSYFLAEDQSVFDNNFTFMFAIFRMECILSVADICIVRKRLNDLGLGDMLMYLYCTIIALMTFLGPLIYYKLASPLTEYSILALGLVMLFWSIIHLGMFPGKKEVLEPKPA